RPAVTPPLPLLLTPLTTPVALTFGDLPRRAVDHFLGIEWSAAGCRALFARARLGHDEHHRDINNDAGPFGEDAGQHEHDADDRHLDSQVRRETIAHPGDHRAVGVPVQPLWPRLCV